MIDTAARNTLARGWNRPRTWLGDVRPTRIEPDDWVTYVSWTSEADSAIARLRATNLSVDALLHTAEAHGLGMVPVWPHEHGPPHPFAELAYTADQCDWIVVAATAVDIATFTADIIIHPLAPTSYSRHTTPTWTIYVTAHGPDDD